MAERIALIDYGAGNLRSVNNALAAAGADGVIVTSDAAIVRGADRIVLPGVGAFAACMAALSALPEMVPAMREAVLEKGAPFLGICVGMQLMADAGEEHGRHAGLGWIAGTVRRIAPANAPDGTALKVPHMGWNDVAPTGAHPLIARGEAYFLHSYAIDPVDRADVLADTDHGGRIVAAVGRANMVGVQYHPEKSQGYGLGFLARFLEWRP